MKKIALLAIVLLFQFTNSFAGEVEKGEDCFQWEIHINLNNQTSREDLLAALHAITENSFPEAALETPARPLSGTINPEIYLSVEFMDPKDPLPGYDIEGDRPLRKKAAEIFAELSKRPGIKAVCHVDNNGPSHNGRGSVSN